MTKSLPESMTTTLSDLIKTSLEASPCADVADQASRVEEESTMHALLAHQRKMKREQEPVDGVYSVVYCEECGLEIDIERVKVAIKNCHCFTCADKAERVFRRR